MDVAVSGASGLIGSALLESLRAGGHRPVALVRRPPTAGADEIAWDPAAGSIDADSLAGIDAVVHLAGAGIGDRRWNEARKRLIWDSRVESTRLLASTLAAADRPPQVFVCGSAVGFYGSRDDETLTEAAPGGSGFLADLVAAWESAAAPAREAGIRTPLARTGLVQSATGGTLAKQLPLFKLGLGGRIGSGRQWLPWITRHDQVRALEHLITGDLDGPVNVCAPNPVTNLEFTKTLGRVLGRPTIFPVPLIGPKVLFGAEMVTELLLASTRAVPAALQESGFRFTHPDLAPALRAMLG